MPYGSIKVDNIIFTNGGVDQTITVSGIVASTSGNLTVTGTISGNIIRGGTTVSGATVTGAVGQFGNLTAVSGVFTTQVSGATVTGNVGQFTSVTGGTAGFTTVTGTTVTGTTANFVTVSGTTVTGTTANFTSGNFTSISGGTHTITSGVFAAGSATNPSISFASDPNTGIYSPGADQVAISTSGTGRLFVNSAGNVGVGTASPNQPLEVSGIIRGGSYQFGASTTDTAEYIGFSNSNGPSIEFWGSATANTGSFLIKTASTERARIDSSGRLLVGTSSASVSARAVFQGNNFSSGQPSIVYFQRDSSSTGLTAGEGITYLPFSDNAGGIYGQIACEVDGSAGSSDYPGRLVFSTTADGASSTTERMRINSAGNVGVGTSSPGELLDVYGGNLQVGSHYVSTLNTNYRIRLRSVGGAANNNYTGEIGLAGGGAQPAESSMTFATQTWNGSSYVVSEKMRIDSSGRLLVGTSSAGSILTKTIELHGAGSGVSQPAFQSYAFPGTGTNDCSYLQLFRSRGSSVGTNTIVASGDRIGMIRWSGANGTGYDSAAEIYAEVDGTPGASGDMPGRIIFATTADGASSSTERMRITNKGNILINKTTAVSGNSNEVVAVSASVSDFGWVAGHPATDGSVRVFLATCPNYNGDDGYLFIGARSGGDVFFIKTNGNVQNTNNSYGAISDIKLKENIVDANSQWNDLKALQVRNYNFKEGQTHTQIGLIAQEVELVSPGLVTESPDLDEDGNDLGTVTKSVNYSVLYMKAVKALQEAMERIEVLEQRLSDAGIA